MKTRTILLKPMKTIYVKFISPNEIFPQPIPTDDETLKRHCFKAYRYPTEFQALEAYANTRCTWSTLLDDSTNVKEFIDTAWDHIKANDENWLELHFT